MILGRANTNVACFVEMRDDAFLLCTYQCQARGGGVGHRVGILTFSKKNYQNPHPYGE